jgi:hypothetical protein
MGEQGQEQILISMLSVSGSLIALSLLPVALKISDSVDTHPLKLFESRLPLLIHRLYISSVCSLCLPTTMIFVFSLLIPWAKLVKHSEQKAVWIMFVFLTSINFYYGGKKFWMYLRDLRYIHLTETNAIDTERRNGITEPSDDKNPATNQHETGKRLKKPYFGRLDDDLHVERSALLWPMRLFAVFSMLIMLLTTFTLAFYFLFQIPLPVWLTGTSYLAWLFSIILGVLLVFLDYETHDRLFLRYRLAKVVPKYLDGKVESIGNYINQQKSKIEEVVEDSNWLTGKLHAQHSRKIKIGDWSNDIKDCLPLGKKVEEFLQKEVIDACISLHKDMVRIMDRHKNIVVRFKEAKDQNNESIELDNITRFIDEVKSNLVGAQSRRGIIDKIYDQYSKEKEP